ncbi:MAG: hypothetical protein AUH29_18175 [Candidatus Rokubacteria bacterium 13_1_40CM_69_27]|nr:MAG: hypothetical protein AUH29_18175 [Candidatus Rokubacteria bacterium 13_1_40CM_69_27]OLC39443.1 MAG: hypothetical protein AUH81_01855 [Candidatus Rokubacteria bacterium 13_1_40CM_4_69_5]OLE36567.1 MAG: hypothetical protein AUG00_10350 [Candidatus Rokubacteria bacterium 13_1_20CM_2_70_7]
MRIFVVDDEPPILQLCRKVLASRGHVVEGFARGEEVLSRLGVESADLLVADYKMPGLDGLELVRRARALRPELRVLMITGHGTRVVIEAAQAAGVDGILVKPFTSNELAEAVSTATTPRPA